MDKKNVLLVFGGNSFEHDISILTALTIYNRAKACKYKLLPLYLSKNNEWFLFFGDNFNIESFKNFNAGNKSDFRKIYFKNDKFVHYKKGLIEHKVEAIAALNCCHGGLGEDGTITAVFNQLNIPVSSGNVLAQAVSMNKIFSKYIFSELNLPIIKYFKFNKQEFLNDRTQVLNKIKRLDYPVILKPATLGSSIGIEVAKNEEEFIKSAEVSIEFDNEILVEKAILDGLREFNVACFKYKNEILISMIEEPKRTEEILSFKDKYIGDGMNTSKGSVVNKRRGKSGAFIDPSVQEVDISEKLKNKIKEIAEKVYKTLDFTGPVRLDFIMDKNKKIYLNEVNSIPGSLAYYLFIPKTFKTMNDYVEAIVDESVFNEQTKNKIKKEYITKFI